MLSIVLPLILGTPQIDAARGVILRTIGSRANSIELRLASDGKNDHYEVNAAGGKLTISGNSGVALCRGFYQYIKNECHSSVSWEGSQIHFPKSWPDAHLIDASPVPYRHYYNICTFGYTTAFWDWKRWQREVDWMALHGINMPLAMTGQDKVWQTVFRSYGLPEKSIMNFFSGPAFQPWHWMGNLNGHGGPPPQSWLDGQAALQKQILAAERSLGMNPVVPGFSGFVPVDFDKYVQGVRLDSPTAWAGFAPTKFIDVRDPKFVEVGSRFVKAYEKEFGTDHLYLCDTFNEQNPQFPAESKLTDLARAGEAVYEGLRSADPDAIWVMQGWLFYNERDYWGQPEVEALLSKVPDGKMIILDLSAEQFPVFKAQPAVAKKGFIYCTLHNFGQNTALGGDIDAYLKGQLGVQSQNVNLLGFGLTPEGIDQNPIVYEELTDAMWNSNAKLGAGVLTERYVAARYGFPNAGVLNSAWDSVSKALYSASSPWYKDGWRQRPGRVKHGRSLTQMAELQRALELMLNEQALPESSYWPTISANPLFQRDLVDLCKTWLGGIADRECAIASTKKDPVMTTRFFKTLDDIDQVMACRPEHRLSTWIKQARSWGKTGVEKDLLERNARLQVTAWDYQGVLTDYANKEWAGLTKDFIARRWRLYFGALLDGKPLPKSADYLKMELAWCDSTVPPKESRPGSAVEVVRQMLLKYKDMAATLDDQMGLLEPPGNLAKGAKASDDGHNEPGGTPDKAIDGDLDTFWAASPSPCTWQLDLGSAQLVKRIVLFPYWGDERYYQYVIETSQTGDEWTLFADASKNQEPTSDQGYTHSLQQPRSVRFLRVRMLKNSANVGVHLCEVRVYKD